MENQQIETNISQVPPSSPEIPKNAGYTFKNILIFADNDPEALKKIIQSFIVSTKEHICLFKQYLQEKQYEEIARLAHKMLPMVRQLEANSLIKPLEKLEHPDKTGLTPEIINTLVTEVIENANQLLKLIQ